MLEFLKDHEKAIECFKINVTNYPASYNVYDSLADAYRVRGDKALAIENYERSLKLNPGNTNATTWLQELRGQNEQK
jgi:tetratricopeptide (TPR) repeat protein